MNNAVSLRSVLQELWKELPGLVDDRIDLLLLELRRAGGAAVQMLMLGVAAALFGLAAWVACWVGIAWGLLAWGLHWGWVVTLVAVFNALAAALALLRASKLVPLLEMAASRRHFRMARPMPPLEAADIPEGVQP
jgi:hypothetical protein